NTAQGQWSFAAGYRAKANHNGTFVWADSTQADFASTGNDQFLIRATGGVGIGINNPAYQLDVADRVRVRQGASPTAGILFYQNTPAADQAFVGMKDDTHVGFYGKTGAGWGMYMDTSNGNVTVGGNICAANFSCSSDARLKQNIRSLNYGLSHLMRLRP